MSLASPEECGQLLYQASLYDNYELLGDLLSGEFVQQLDWRDTQGRTALHAASSAGHIRCLQLLIDAGADVNVSSGPTGNYKTPLQVSAESGHTDAVRVLVKAGADLFVQDRSGHCALELAQMAGRMDSACALIDAIEQHHIKVNVLRDKLEKACIDGDFETAQSVLHQADTSSMSVVLNGATDDDYSALYRCCERGYVELVDLLLQYGADGRVHPVTFYSPLYIAVHAGHTRVVEILLKHFPELVSVQTFEGWLPLHACCKTGDLLALRRILFHQYPEYVMQTFTDSSGKWNYRFAFDINTQDADCRTPLYVACREGNFEAVKLLLDVEVKAIDQCEPSRVTSGHKQESFEDVLVKDDCETGSNDSQPVGDSPVKKARSKLNVLNAKKSHRRASPRSFKPVTVDVYCGKGRTPLQVATAGGFVNIVKILVEKGGANINLPIAITDEELAELNPAEGLLCAGSGALMEACKKGDPELVDLLLEYGAMDHDNRALDVCLIAGHERLACRLLCRQVFSDPEFRVNKKGVEPESQLLGLGRAVVPSALYPAVASMLNWHRAGLTVIRDSWILSASVHLNPKMRTMSHNRSLALAAITRVDISKNQLDILPLSLFQLPSLRILNAGRNKIASISVTIESGDGSGRQFYGWSATVLEEIHLDHNELEFIPEQMFTLLPNLQALDVSNNKITTLSHAMWTAPKLKDLNLSYNKLTSLPSWTYASDSIANRPPSVSDEGPDTADSSCTLSVGSVGGISGTSLEELRASSSLTEGPERIEPKSADDNVFVQELQRHNLWQKSVELSKVYDEDEEPSCAFSLSSHNIKDMSKRKVRSNLTSLNLSHNQLKRVPECLPCVAPYLTRINLSSNNFLEMGPISNYPSKLKHLDLSSNRIMYWFSRPRTIDDLICHHLPNRDVVTRGLSPSRRRSQSTTRGHRSLSVSRGGGGAEQSSLSFSMANICPHKRHTRLDNLRTLVLAGNRLDRICLHLNRMNTGSSTSSLDDDKRSLTDTHAPSPDSVKSRLVFPCLTMLDISNNQLLSIPAALADLSSLSVLNLSNNPDITSLPPQMGLLTKLWNLSLNGCNLDEPLRTMLDSKKYKTMDIIGYLKSVLEDSKPYARMKLMIVGIQGIGKTSLLEQLRPEGSVAAKKNSNEGWAKRMGHKNVGTKTTKGTNISTVGVDVGDWTFEPKRNKNQPTYGPVTFRTWDFGGQREYYATHQYFLSRRSLYIVVWRITDGEAGINEISQWLVNIQARALNSPVIIVGTHFDEVLANSKKFPPSFVDDLQQTIRERFVAIQDADKKGLPRVVDSVVVSSKTRYNIRNLCNLIYSTAYDQRSPGSKERLLEQKIPSSYMALEEIVGMIADERKLKGRDPVLSGDQYRVIVQKEMTRCHGKQFRDLSELNQATAFLHENGVMLHYEDATLKELYFLDPQWLCDILAHVITIREINPFAKNGLMRLDDLKLLFKSSKFTPTNIRTYIVNLLQKFEVALTWDSRNLLIPSLLPDEYQVRGGYSDCEVKVPIKGKGWNLVTQVDSSFSGVPPPVPSYPSNSPVIKGNSFYAPSTEEQQALPRPIDQIKQFFSFDSLKESSTVSPEESSKNVPLFTMNKPDLNCDEMENRYCLHNELIDEESIKRLYVMSYIPSGFWSRLITRLLGDEHLPALVDKYFRLVVFMGQRVTSKPELHDQKLRKILDSNKPEWLLWQTGLEIRAFGQLLFSLKEFLPLAEVRDVHYSAIGWRTCHEDGIWRQLKIGSSSIIEIFVPTIRMTFRYKGQSQESKSEFLQLETDISARTKLLSCVVDVIDTLLEDWYPSLGTRFVHTSEGKLLVSRLVPCPRCLVPFRSRSTERADEGWTILSLDGADTISCASLPAGPNNDDQGIIDKIHSVSAYNLAGLPSNALYDKVVEPSETDCVFSFTVEDCILCAHTGSLPDCPSHGLTKLSTVAPDTVFLDVGGNLLISPERVKRGKMLGRGAFGFVFKASVKFKDQMVDVALKMLQPVDPGFGARQSASAAYKAAWAKWQRDPSQYACRAYCTARQELNVLSALQHPHVVSLVGVCPRPLALVVCLAPLGALSVLLQNYRRSGARLQLTVLQETLSQVAKALEYLHQNHIIYRDLKSENVLTWRYPPPFNHLTDVDIKLGDYGISRSVFPSGGAKGFGGTEGFMAPEIMRYNGEEEYTEKVDVFSFAMFAYELLTLKLPFEGQEQVKEFMLDGGRPQLTPSELLYPCNILDLMVVSWSHQPSDRPSSSQLVSITTAPEFSHLMDVVSLNDSDATVLVGETFSVDESDSTEDGGSSNGDDNSFEGELWLSRSDGQIAVLSCNQHGWLDYKNIYVNDDSFVTAMCLVEDTVWLGELTGIIRVFCAKTYCELYSFPLAPHVLPMDTSPRHAVSLPVAEILSLPSLRLILIVTGQPGALLLCRMIDNLGGQGADPVLASVKVSQRELHCVSALPETNGKVELWVGQSAGYLATFLVSGETLEEDKYVNHYDPPVEGVEVYKLCSSTRDNSFVWSYVYPGSILYQWNTAQKAIVAKLDCSKIAPCSESISTMNIEDKICPGRCQVTALSLVDRNGLSQLYVGTTWGVVIVAEADRLRPVAAFRPHLEDVRVVLPLDSTKRAGLLAQMPNKGSTGSKGSGSGHSGKFPGSWALRLTSDSRKSSPAKEKSYEKTTNSYVLTVGKGYRCLIQRFLDNYREEPAVLDSRNKDSFAVMWRTDDWLN